MNECGPAVLSQHNSHSEAQQVIFCAAMVRRTIAHQQSRAARVIAPAVHAVSVSRAIKKPGRFLPGVRRTCLPNQYITRVNFTISRVNSRASQCCVSLCWQRRCSSMCDCKPRSPAAAVSQRSLAGVAAFPISRKIKKPGRFLPGFRRSFLPTQYITRQLLTAATPFCFAPERLEMTRSDRRRDALSFSLSVPQTLPLPP